MLPQGYDWADPEEQGEEAERLAKTEINILSNRDVEAVVTDESGDVAGVLLVAHDKTSFTFDIVIAKEHRRKGLARALAKVAIDMYEDLKDVYGDDYEIEVDVVNPMMRKILEELGFKATREWKSDRALMTYSESSGPAYYYHVTPWSRWKQIQKEGLAPHREDRGIFAHDAEEPRIYLFDDPDSAEDGLAEWMLELPKFEDEVYAAMIRVDVGSEIEVHEDPELAGSFYVTSPISASRLKLHRQVELGEPDDLDESKRGTLADLRRYLADRSS